MIPAERVEQLLETAASEFRDSAEYRALLAGEAPAEAAREFVRNVFRTHFLSAHIVALCYAALPSGAAELLKENLLEEMGRSEHEEPHSSLLVQMARALDFSQSEIDELIADSRRRVAVFCATRVPAATLRELCLAVLLETMSFEFMLSRCSSEIASALTRHYGFPAASLRWFELHSEVDLRHAEEGIEVVRDYLAFHGIDDDLLERIAGLTLGDRLFARHYFPAASRRKTRMRSGPAGARRIDAITVYRLRIPFHRPFRHALQSREESDSVIVKVTGSDGGSGYGESLPRSYVTGETIDAMADHLRQRLGPEVLRESFAPGWETLEYLETVMAEWTQSSAAGVTAWNAAFCALELALLDWALRADACTLADLLPPKRLDVAYSGVVSADAPAEAAALARRMAQLGLREIKVKVGACDDAARLDAVRRAVGENVELRADANGAWAAAEALKQLERLAPFRLRCIEQPVAAGDLDGLKRVREQCGIAVMADESLVTLEQARRLIARGACDAFNVRLSKCAGIAGSLAIARLAQEAGIRIQVGAQVGETGILSAAARALAAHLPELAHAEGSFGTWLLAEDITFESTGFGPGGRAPLLGARGLGVTVREEALERLAVAKHELRR